MITLYFICIIFFLLPVCILITIEIYKLLINNMMIYKINIETSNRTNNTNYILNLAEIYIKQKKWLRSILLLESNKNNIPNNNQYYHPIAFCYYKIQLYDLAEFYYNKSIEDNNEDIHSLLNIAKIYQIKQNTKKAINTYAKILDIDHKNDTAKKQIEILYKDNNRDSRT